MRAPSRRMLAQLLGGVGLVALVLPASAQAHGIVGKADLPIPVWLFSWTAAIVLVVSFVALSTMWTRPQLQQPRLRRLFRLPRALEWLAGLFGVAVFALVVYSGFAGAQVTQANFSVTFIYVVFWVGTPVASVLFGDVFHALSPWRTCARVCAALLRLLRRGRPGSPPLRYPQWLGVWPATAGIVGFAWLELIYIERDRPSTLAALSLGYFLAMLAGMALFGVEEWSSQADGFGVYFNLLSKLSALVRGPDGVVYLRRPLSGVTDLRIRAGTVALICTQIGTTTFDGFSNGGIWRNNEPSLQSLFEDLGLHPTPAQELAYSVGLVFCILLITAVYRVGILGVRKVSERYDRDTLTRTFAHSLVPIAFAYVLAHYFSLLLWQSQAMVYLASDPLGNGSNVFGTSGFQIDYHVISYAAIWYVQVAALVSGHVGGLALAHDRALVLYKDPEEAVRSQYWMLAVMVAFTSFGLWLLSAVGT
ncbi:MAG: fenitrothion hydrolase [Solirubrobacteraceae bacterium]